MSNTEIVPVDSQFLPPESAELQTDLDYARKNLQGLIEKGSESLEGIISVADQSQHPRAYEVLNQSLSTLAELNKDLVDIAYKKRSVKETGPKEMDGKVVNQSIFVGTPADLQELLSKGVLKGNQ